MELKIFFCCFGVSLLFLETGLAVPTRLVPKLFPFVLYFWFAILFVRCLFSDFFLYEFTLPSGDGVGEMGDCGHLVTGLGAPKCLGLKCWPFFYFCDCVFCLFFICFVFFLFVFALPASAFCVAYGVYGVMGGGGNDDGVCD